MKFLDLSGYGFSGKHAVIDLVREIGDYHVPHFTFEFALFRIPGGILDLESALHTDWSPVRSDAAIRRFKRTVRRLGAGNKWTRPGTWFEAVGWNYDDYFAGRFFPLSDAFVRRLIQASWRANWPYARAELTGAELFVRKLARIARIRAAMDFEVHLAAPADFVSLSKQYVYDILTSNAPAGTRAVVMHNAFEPFQPQRCFKYFDEVRSIIVDRDPRDTYVQQLAYRPMAVGPDDFVARYRIYRQQAARFHSDDPRILRLRFEDLVTRYDETLPRILAHLGESGVTHVAPKRHFDPAVSAKNVGLWKRFERQEEIAVVARGLQEFLYFA